MGDYGPDLVPWAENSAAISQAVFDFNDVLSQAFKLDAEAGHDLLRVIDNMIVETRDILNRSYIYTQELKLGKKTGSISLPTLSGYRSY